MSNITIAQAQYFSRPADEKFNSIDTFLADARSQKMRSGEKVLNIKDLAVVASDAIDAPRGTRTETGFDVLLKSPSGITAPFTNWSFSQFARTVGGSAKYLSSLPAQIVADALNFGIHQTPSGTDVNLLIEKRDDGSGLVRAATSDSYGRVWDYDLDSTMNTLLRRESSDWQLPPVWGSTKDSPKYGGAYRGDRDSFFMLINGGSIVHDPSASNVPGDDGTMYRGIMIRNSEVGASAVNIDVVLYRYICGNLCLWGASFDTRFSRRHVGKNAIRDTMREVLRIGRAYSSLDPSRDERLIKMLIDRQLATTKEGIVDELRKLGATKEDAIAAYEKTEMTERIAPTSYWGIAQGLTRLSQDDDGARYQDSRYVLDQIAAAVLRQGTKLVAA